MPQSTTPALPYHINRTASKKLPIYNITKGGGQTSKLTRLRKIDGDLAELRRDLQQALQLKDDHININQLTRHIIIKVRLNILLVSVCANHVPVDVGVEEDRSGQVS